MIEILQSLWQVIIYPALQLIIHPMDPYWGTGGSQWLVWCAVVLAPIFVMLLAKFLLRNKIWGILIACALVAVAVSVYQTFDMVETVAECSGGGISKPSVSVRQSAPIRPIADFIDGMTTGSSSRFDSIIVTDSNPNNAKRIQLYIFVRYLLLLYFTALGFAVLGRRLCDFLFAWIVMFICRVSFYDMGMVFWGYSSETAVLLDDVWWHRPWWYRMTLGLVWRPVVAIEQENQKSATDRLVQFDKVEDLRAYPVYERITDELQSCVRVPGDRLPFTYRWRLWAHRHFLFGTNDTLNMALCQTIVLAQRPRWLPRWFYRHKTIYVNLRSTDMAEELKIWLSRNKDRIRECKVDVRIQLLPNMLADDFVRKFPVLQAPSINLKKCPIFSSTTEPMGTAKRWGTYRLLIIGGGPVGTAILNASIHDAQFEGLSFQATVVDRDHHVENRYRLRYPTCVNAYDIRFETADIDDPDYLDKLEQAMFGSDGVLTPNAYSRIVVCLGDAMTNCRVARRIGLRLAHADGTLVNPRLNPRNLVFASSANTLDGGWGNCSCFQIFGLSKDAFSVENVLREQHLTLAKRINYAYCNKKEDSKSGSWWWDASGALRDIEKCWAAQTDYDRRSSIACAEGMSNWFRLCGCTEIDRNSEPCRLACESIVRQIAYFERCEHLRWMAYERIDGVGELVWDESGSSLPFGDKSGYRAKKMDTDGVTRWHAALCSFDDLRQLDDVIDKLNRRAYNEGRLKKQPSISSLFVNDRKILEAIVSYFKDERHAGTYSDNI